MAAPIFHRSEIMRGLSILYPPEHGIIELVAIKKDGYLLSSRFTDREKMVDEIAKYDGRNDIAAIYTTLNRLDEGTFQRDDHVLIVDESLASGPRVDSGNVARVTGILFDIDPFRANGDKKDSTTDSEHQAAIEAADFLKHKLSFMGWPEPVVGSSGNGAALRYLCDLAASKETTDLISRMLKAANGMLPEELAAQVEVDPAVFDLPRISKVFGTTTRKGPGTTERPHRRAAVISAPERLEPVNIDCLIKLAAAGKRQDDAPHEPHQDRTTDRTTASFSSDAAERLQALFADEPGFKSRLFSPVSEGDDRSKAEFHFCARLWEVGFSEDEIYHIMSHSPQTKWLRRDDKYRWDTIKEGIAKAEENHKERTNEEAKKEAAKKTTPIELKDVADIAYDENDKIKKVRFSPTYASCVVLERMQLAMSDDSEAIHRFTGQIYRHDGARIIDGELCDVAGDLFTNDKLKETMRRIKNELLENPVVFDPNPYLLGVKNGVVDLSTGTFREYRPEDLITDQIDVTYDQAAKCPRTIQFLEEVEPVVIDRLMLVDWFAIHAIRLMFAYVMFLLGLGRNGKGIYERLMMRFFKDESFSEMPLEELNVKNNRFAGAALKGKRGQIVSEAGEERKPGSKRTIPTNYLKFSTGDGTIDSDQKGTIRTRFKPLYKATIDCNDMPLIGDVSKGWIERFCKVNMPFVFVDEPRPGTLERKKDPYLFEKLTTDSELSGILNLILTRTPELIRTKTIIKRSGAEMFAEYQKQSSSVNTFLEAFCDYKPVSDKSKDVFLDLIFEKYEAWCDLTVADKVDDKRFGKAVKTFCKGTEPERVHDGDKRRKIYHGLSFDINRYQSHWDHYK